MHWIRSLFLVLGLFALPCLGSCKAEEPTSNNLVCEPGATAFCHCADGVTSGQRLCNSDGMSFAACMTKWGGECTLQTPDSNTPGEAPSQTAQCQPGSQIYCQLDGCTNSSQTCQADGQGYEACSCNDSGDGSGGNDGGDAKLPLFAPCTSGSECDSGECLGEPQGICSHDCDSFLDCESALSECVNATCLPTCNSKSDCGAYSPTWTCGYTTAMTYDGETTEQEYSPDSWGAAVCFQWGDAWLPAPFGSSCIEDQECNYGYSTDPYFYCDCSCYYSGNCDSCGCNFY